MKFVITEEEKKRIKLLYEQITSSSGKFETKKDGITDFVVVNIPNKDAKTLFEKTINWVSETYKTPEKVISSKNPNERIILDGSHELGGGPNYLNYRIIISFKENKYKFEVTEIKIVGSAIGNYDYKRNLSQYFKDDGTPKPRLSSAVSEIETLFNSLNESLEKYLNSPNIQKDNW